jgi:hypothetical protein
LLPDLFSPNMVWSLFYRSGKGEQAGFGSLYLSVSQAISVI